MHSPPIRLSFFTTTLCLLLAGCDAPEPEPEVDERELLACVPPTPGMVITQNTVLCQGTYPMTIAAGQAAITIAADDVTLTCLGTRISGVGAIGPSNDPNVGIRIDGRDGVTVDGCAADHFRYGLVARDAAKLVLSQLDLDDNFTDPAAGWVQDTVQGGGVRLERVVDGTVWKSSLARNWNGIELRDSADVKVQGNDASHCSNTGATLVGADDNRLIDNNFSWGIRGAGLAYPGSWYGVDTRDSAGLIVDAGSTGNLVQNNDLSFGGDGIFVRSVIGACATGNTFIGNDTSFSPHNAIESWCDDNKFIANDASFSHYGIWLGGSDRALVVDNTVEGNLIDGISMQIGESRHTMIDGNTITGNGRAGILFTGREYQAWHDLETHWGAALANSSHTVIQRNYFDDNAEYDLFTSSTRGLVTAGNCTEVQWGGPNLVFYSETEIARNFGGCVSDETLAPPTVTLAQPPPIVVGTPVQLQASIVAGLTQSKVPTKLYNWLVQPAGERFVSGSLPPIVYGSASTANATPLVTFQAPGAYDIDVIGYDHTLAGLAHRQVHVAPPGTRIGTLPGSWAATCTSFPQCVTTITAVAGGVEGDAVSFVSNAPFGVTLRSPAVDPLNLNAAQASSLGFFVRASNPNQNGWQGPNPIVRIVSSAGSITYTPSGTVLPTALGEWSFVRVPLAGGEGWTRTVAGGSLADIDRVELTVDTWGGDPFELQIDTLSVY